MARHFNYKKTKKDSLFPRLYSACAKGLLFEERRILSPIGRAPLLSGIFSRELTYLVMLFSAIYKLPNTKKLRGRIVNVATEYAAHIDVMLSYIVAFHASHRKISPILSRAFNISSMYNPAKVVALENLITQFHSEVDVQNRDADYMASLVGNVFSEVFVWEDGDYADVLSTVGFYLGKYTYLANSYVNLRKDEKKGYYNPLIYVKRKNLDVFETYVRQTIQSQADACMEAFYRLPIDERYDFLENVLAQYFASQYLQR